MIVADSYPNFSICGLPYYISREVTDWRNLAHRTKQDIEDQSIQLLLEHTAQAIHPETKQVTVMAPSRELLDYDKLVIATGAVSLQPKISGINNPGVFFLRWMPDSLAIDRFLTEQKPRTAVIVGAGYIGMEMAESLTKRGVKVTIIEYAESVLPSVDSDFGKKIQDTLIQNGIFVYNNISVESIEKNEDKLLIKGTNRFEAFADMVLVSVGSIPNSSLGTLIGIQTGIRGALKVNRKMETGIPDIYAAGDCVETWHKVLCWTTWSIREWRYRRR